LISEHRSHLPVGVQYFAQGVPEIGSRTCAVAALVCRGGVRGWLGVGRGPVHFVGAEFTCTGGRGPRESGTDAGLTCRAVDVIYGEHNNVESDSGFRLWIFTAMHTRKKGLVWVAPTCSSWGFLCRHQSRRPLASATHRSSIINREPSLVGSSGVGRFHRLRRSTRRPATNLRVCFYCRPTPRLSEHRAKRPKG
jgi:hypothetical protein